MKKEDAVRFIKTRRIDCLELVERMNANRMPRKFLYEKICTERVRGRPKLRWSDVREDLGILKVEDWRSTVMDRDAWRLSVKEAKANKGL
jgi:hypothetical protein